MRYPILLAVASFANAAASAAEPVRPVAVALATATSACFSDLVRATGFAVARRSAVANVETEGSRVAEILVREGDRVAGNQELVRLSSAAPNAPRPAPLRAPVAGLVTEVRTAVGAPASPSAPPMIRIAVESAIEIEAEVPGIHMLKINPGASTRIVRDGAAEIAGRVRLVSPDLDRTTQLGRVRIAMDNAVPPPIGAFVRVTIDARRSCGVSVPRGALDKDAVQLVRDGKIETRRVRAGLTSATSVEILDGLAEGDTVVANAGTSLHDGDAVRALRREEIERMEQR